MDLNASVLHPSSDSCPTLHSLLGAGHWKEFYLLSLQCVRVKWEVKGSGLCRPRGAPLRVWGCAQFPGEHPAWHLITPSLVRGFCESSQRKVIDERDVWSELHRPAPNVYAYINIDWIFEGHVNCSALEERGDSCSALDWVLWALNMFESVDFCHLMNHSPFKEIPWQWTVFAHLNGRVTYMLMSTVLTQLRARWKPSPLI